MHLARLARHQHAWNDLDKVRTDCARPRRELVSPERPREPSGARDEHRGPAVQTADRRPPRSPVACSARRLEISRCSVARSPWRTIRVHGSATTLTVRDRTPRPPSARRRARTLWLTRRRRVRSSPSPGSGLAPRGSHETLPSERTIVRPKGCAHRRMHAVRLDAKQRGDPLRATERRPRMARQESAVALAQAAHERSPRRIRPTEPQIDEPLRQRSDGAATGSEHDVVRARAKVRMRPSAERKRAVVTVARETATLSAGTSGAPHPVQSSPATRALASRRGPYRKRLKRLTGSRRARADHPGRGADAQPGTGAKFPLRKSRPALRAHRSVEK